MLGGLAAVAGGGSAAMAYPRCAVLCGNAPENLLQCSNNFTGSAVWELFNGTTVTPNGDGTTTLNIPAGNAGIDQRINWVPGAVYTFSIWAKLGNSGTQAILLWNPGNSGSNGSQVTKTITLTNQLTRYSLTFQAPSILGTGGNTPNIAIVSTGFPNPSGAGVNMVIARAKLEYGGVPTKYGTDTGCPASQGGGGACQPGVNPWSADFSSDFGSGCGGGGGGGGGGAICGGSAPSQAAAVGYTNLAFCDDFVTLSVAPGHVAGNGFTWANQMWFQSFTNPPGSMSVSNSILTLAGGQGDITITTHGNITFNHGYFECSMAWDPSQLTSTPGPAFWLFSESHTNGTDGSGSTEEWMELDVQEGYNFSPPAMVSTFHDWIAFNNAQNTNNVNNVPSGTNFTQFHKYGVLWVPSNASLGHNGFVRWYFDDAVMAEQDWTPSGTYSPPLNGTGGSTNNIGDHDTLYIVLTNQNSNGPFQIDWVRAWT